MNGHKRLLLPGYKGCSHKPNYSVKYPSGARLVANVRSNLPAVAGATNLAEGRAIGPDRIGVWEGGAVRSHLICKQSSEHGHGRLLLPSLPAHQQFQYQTVSSIASTHSTITLPDLGWYFDWNVNSRAMGSSEASIKCLAPYVFRVAISNSRIVEHKVFFRIG